MGWLRLSDEYLFGDDLLVAPILSESSRRRVYLPRGTWTDWWTQEQHCGPVWLEVDADLETIPLYLREGAVMPMGPVMNYVNEKPVDVLEVLIAPFAHDGRTVLTVPLKQRQIQLDYTADA